MTPFPAEPGMWKDYADNHTGYCVGFNPKILFSDEARFGRAGMVEYYPEELPIIHPNEHWLEKTHKQVFSKRAKFEYEKEYRLLKSYENEEGPLSKLRIAIVPEAAFVEVIIGVNIPETWKNEIFEVMAVSFPNIPLKQARITAENTIEIENLY